MATLDMEGATKKMKPAALDMEASTKRAIIPILPDDVILSIFRFLDTQDRIAFAISCEAFRRVCMDESSAFKKVDLSRCPLSTTQRSEMNKFFRDRQLTQHIRELNISNLHVLNWQMDDQLEEFILSCPHLEALHVLNCQMSLLRLHRILKQAPEVTSLSWSLWDFMSEDIQFIVKSIESYEEICLKNIKHLHLEMLVSKSHLQIAKHLLLSCFRDVEELEIYIWWIDMESCTGWNLPLKADQSIPGFPQPSVVNELQHLQSLMVFAVGEPTTEYANDYDDDEDDNTVFGMYKTYAKELYDFGVLLLKRRSKLKWKKFWITPSTCISRWCPYDFSLLLDKDDFQSVEEIAADPGWYAEHELKTSFQQIGDNTIRSLHLWLPNYRDSFVDFFDPILRVGGHALKYLGLSARLRNQKYPEQNMSIHSLFSNCSNIMELDLLPSCFEKDICKPLSELKHLSKVQLLQCALISKHSKKTRVGMSKANLVTFVENCKNVTDLDVRGCWCLQKDESSHATDDDLLTVAKLRNLKSLTLYEIAGIREWNFLKKIMESCKYLALLRIYAFRDFNNSHDQFSMESVNFLQHLALNVRDLYKEGTGIGSESFWNLLSHAKNLQRLCIMSRYSEWLNIPAVAVQTLKSLPRLHVVHLHSENVENAEVFHRQMKRILEEKGSECRFSFEIVTGNKRTWNNQHNGYSLISNKALPLNEAELCEMRPILEIPRF